MKTDITARKHTLMLLFAAIVLRALIPVGYMPGSLHSGLLFELCPDGMPAGFVLALDGQHHHHEADEQSNAHSFEQCTLGHLAVTGAVPSFANATLDLPEQFQAITNTRSYVATAPVAAYSSRAPPVV